MIWFKKRFVRHSEFMFDDWAEALSILHDMFKILERQLENAVRRNDHDAEFDHLKAQRLTHIAYSASFHAHGFSNNEVTRILTKFNREDLLMKWKRISFITSKLHKHLVHIRGITDVIVQDIKEDDLKGALRATIEGEKLTRGIAKFVEVNYWKYYKRKPVRIKNVA